MGLVAESQAKERGNEVCRVLLLRGRRPTRFYTVGDGDRIIVVFDVIAVSPFWRKAVDLPAADATPDTFDQALAAWKEKVREELRHKRPSQVVMDAIAAFGEDTVRLALA